MNTAELTQQWLELLATLAAEVLVVGVALWFALRTRLSSGWRRAFCQAGLTGVVVIFAFEFSGMGRGMASWVALAVGTDQRPQSANAKFEAVGMKKVESAAAQLSAAPLIDDPTPPIQVDGVSSALVRPNVPSTSSTERTLNGTAVLKSAASVHTGTKNSRLLPALAALWLGGSATLVIRTLLSRFVLVIWRSRGQVVIAGDLLSVIRVWSQALGMQRRVRLVESTDLTSPVAFGALRPTIGLPLNFANRFDPSKREAILVHELAHLAGHDPFWCLLADIVTALLWWHPAAWWMRHHLRLTSELVADEATLLIKDGPRSLSECLVEIGVSMIKRPIPGHLSAAGFRSSLGCRVQRLIEIEGSSFQRPDRKKATLLKLLGPMVVAAIIFVCTAWTSPRVLTNGENMNTTGMKQSLATLTLAALIGGIDTQTAILAQAPGELGGRAASPQYTRRPSSENDWQPAPGALAANRDPRAGAENPYQPGNFGQPGGGHRWADPERGARLEAKLRDIVLDEVTFNGMPLAEVLRFASDESRKHDPEKKGINFLIKPGPVSNPGGPAIDPTTGLPVASSETIDVGATSISFNLPLRHITMKDLLDAVVKVADKPIEYTLEDYGVIFSIRPETAGAMPVSAFYPGQQSGNRLAVSTFHVNTKSFAAGIESVFGIKLASGDGGKDGVRSRQVQSAMKELMAQLGINMEGGKTVFYNELSGVLMVRGTVEDLDVVRAAIETLGEPEQGQSTGFGFAPGRADGVGQPDGALTEEEQRFRTRYGLQPATEERMRQRYGLPPGGSSNSSNKP
jgi:beta-lactamase regulating signal transducer with metallopeptidase domain